MVTDNRNKYLGVDPGHTTGYAILSSWQPIALDISGHVLFEDVPDWLQGLPEDIDMVVMEEFKLLPGKATYQATNSNSQMKTSQVEGMVKLWAAQRKIPVVMQSPAIKASTEKQSGLKPSGSHNKNSHWIDAFNHLYYYGIRNGFIKVRTS